MESGLILATPEIADLVNPWLLATSENAQLGAPPHVTLLFPWLAAPVTEADLDRARSALHTFGPVTLTFREVRRWPEVVWLWPEPESAVRAMTEALMAEFPECPPYDGKFSDPQPHLTVAEGSGEKLSRVEAAVADALAAYGPVAVRVAEVAVAERQPDRSWQVAHTIGLTGG
jgi:2'-5' RNA ligase